MTGYKILTIDKMLEIIGEDRLNTILSEFCCPLNEDIEDFLRHKAIQFSKQGLAKTHLVFASYRDQYVLVGYFSLANKTLFISDKKQLGRNLRSRLNKFSVWMPETKMRILSAPLIAQLGKNYYNGYNQLITGDELLKMACERILETQLVIGGKVAYLECEDIPELVCFYEDNGFRQFDQRKTDTDTYLIQMIRYF